MTEASPVPVRHVRFSWPDDLEVIWIPDEPEFAIAANAVSLLMPHAEPYVVWSTRQALSESLISPKDPISIEARAYVAQEAQHHAQHRRFNDLLTLQVPAISRLDRHFGRIFSWLKRRGCRFGLAFAAAFETIAFVAARWVDRNQRHLRGADPSAATMFLWHLAEEVEHKSVAFNTYMATGGGRLRYGCAVVVAALVLAWGALLGSLTMMRSTGRLWKPMSHLKLARWSLSFVFAAMPTMVVSALPGHHPDQLANPAGLDNWLSNFDENTSSVPPWALP